MKRVLGMVAACALLALAGCGDDDPSDGNGSAAEAGGGDVPVTPRALAAVAAEYAGTPSSAMREIDAAEEFKPNGVSAELRYGAGGEYDGDSLVVAVGTGLDDSLSSCETMPSYVGHCAEMDGGLLFWDDMTPEEDPGVIYVTVPKGDATVLMFHSGPNITSDPRELDMAISIDDLFAIANDPRVDLTTSQDAIDAGAELAFWQD